MDVDALDLEALEAERFEAWWLERHPECAALATLDDGIFTPQDWVMFKNIVWTTRDRPGRVPQHMRTEALAAYRSHKLKAFKGLEAAALPQTPPTGKVRRDAPHAVVKVSSAVENSGRLEVPAASATSAPVECADVHVAAKRPSFTCTSSRLQSLLEWKRLRA